MTAGRRGSLRMVRRWQFVERDLVMGEGVMLGLRREIVIQW